MKQETFVQRSLLTAHQAMDMFKYPSSDGKEKFHKGKLHLTLKPFNVLVKNEVSFKLFSRNTGIQHGLNL